MKRFKKSIRVRMVGFDPYTGARNGQTGTTESGIGSTKLVLVQWDNGQVYPTPAQLLQPIAA